MIIYQTAVWPVKTVHITRINESTAGADASVEALKLYDMKILTYSSAR